MKKRIGQIIDGKWKIIKKTDKTHYLLKNIFNESELILEYRIVIKGNISKYVSKYVIGRKTYKW